VADLSTGRSEPQYFRLGCIELKSIGTHPISTEIVRSEKSCPSELAGDESARGRTSQGANRQRGEKAIILPAERGLKPRYIRVMHS